MMMMMWNLESKVTRWLTTNHNSLVMLDSNESGPLVCNKAMEQSLTIECMLGMRQKLKPKIAGQQDVYQWLVQWKSDTHVELCAFGGWGARRLVLRLVTWTKVPSRRRGSTTAPVVKEAWCVLEAISIQSCSDGRLYSKQRGRCWEIAAKHEFVSLMMIEMVRDENDLLQDKL